MPFVSKHSFFLLLVFIVFSSKTYSSPLGDSSKVRLRAWNGNKTILSAGAGFPNYEKQDILSNLSSETYTITKVRGSGPFHVKLEHAFTDRIGFGLSFNYSEVNVIRIEPAFNRYSPNPYDTAIYKLSFLSLNLRANYHFMVNKFLDSYIGLGLGFKQFKIKFQNAGKNNFNGAAYVENYGLPIGLELTFGLRCFVNKYLGFYLETGISRSIVQIGVCFNIGRN